MKNQVMGILFLALLSSCGVNSDKSPLTFGTNTISSGSEIKVDPTKDTDIAFANIQIKIVNVSCLKCHGPNQKNHINLTSKALFLDNYDDILYRMTGAFDMGIDNMPPNGNPVAPELIKELKAWKADIGFANLQQTLFEKSCLKCHGAEQKKHSNLTSKAIVLEKFDDIVYRITTAFDDDNDPMPPVGKGAKVSPELVKELQKWKASL
jgi:mono/diheme cytochrome c family protein